MLITWPRLKQKWGVGVEGDGGDFEGAEKQTFINMLCNVDDKSLD